MLESRIGVTSGSTSEIEQAVAGTDVKMAEFDRQHAAITRT
jgi:hypothetical protein